MKQSQNQDVSEKPEKDDILRLMRFLQILQIHRWLALSVFLVVFAIIMIFALKQPSSYMAQYDLFYNETIQEYMNESDVPIVKSDFDKNFWMSNMISYEIAKKTANYSGLSYSATQMRQMISVEMMDKKKEDRAPLYKVTVISTKAADIPIIIRSYLHALNDLLIKHQIGNSERLIGYLNAQIQDNNEKLDGIDQQILGGGPAKSGEIYDSEKAKSDLESFRTALLNAQINLSTLRASKNRTEHELKNLDGTIVNESAFSEPLKVQLMNLEVDLARALTKYKEDHPAVKAIRKNIEQINAMLRDNVEQKMEIKSLVQNPLKSQLMSKLMDLQIGVVSEETHVQSLQKVIAELEQKTLPNAKDESVQQMLRNRDMVFITIKQLNSKKIEAGSAASGSMSRFVIVDEPSTPIVPANKQLWKFLLIALIAGIVAGLGTVLIYDLLDNRIMVISDYTQFYTLPIWSILTHFKKDHRPEQDVNMSYRRRTEMSDILINIRHALKTKNIRIYAVCSSIRREGKTQVSLQLATTLADKRLKVLLVDIDFFDPKLSTQMESASLPGLSDYITGEAGLDTIIRPTKFENLSFVSAGTVKGRPDHFYEEAALSDFIQNVRSQYDVVLIDTPAALYIPDVFNFLNLIDGVLIIVRLRHTTRTALDKLFLLVRGHQTRLMGTIINDAPHQGLEKYNAKNGYPYYKYSYDNSTSQPEQEQEDDDQYPDRKPHIFKKIFLWTLAVLIIGGLSLAGYSYYKFRKGLAALPTLPVSTYVAPATQPDACVAPDSSVAPAVAPATNTTPVVTSKSAPVKTVSGTTKWLDTVKLEGGNRLTLLAQKYYGNKEYWVYIYLSNKSSIPDPNKVKSGITLYIPSLSSQGIDTKDPNNLLKAKALQTKILSGAPIDNATQK